MAPSGQSSSAVRREVEQQIASLPLPVESNVIAFDRAATELLPFAEVVRETTPEHQRAIVGHIVERVTITDRQVTGIGVRLEAKPFFSDLIEGEEDVWRWRPRTDSSPQHPRSGLGLLPRGRIEAA
jgi:hypothetical protein